VAASASLPTRLLGSLVALCICREFGLVGLGKRHLLILGVNKPLLSRSTPFEAIHVPFSVPDGPARFLLSTR